MIQSVFAARARSRESDPGDAREVRIKREGAGIGFYILPGAPACPHRPDPIRAGDMQIGGINARRPYCRAGGVKWPVPRKVMISPFLL